MPRVIRAPLAGLLAFTIATLVSNVLFFQLGTPVLFDPGL